MNPTDEARLDWSEDGPDEGDVLADNEVLTTENARLNAENDSLRKLVEAMREEVVQSILLNSDYARERDDARTRADAFAKELAGIAEALPLRPTLLKPDGTVTPTGPDRPAGQVRAIVAELERLRRWRTAGLQLADNLIAAIGAMPTASATPVVHDIALDIRRALGVTE